MSWEKVPSSTGRMIEKTLSTWILQGLKKQDTGKSETREIPVVPVVTLGGNQSGACKDKRSIVWLIPVTSYAYRMRVIKNSRWRTGSEKNKK